MRRRVSLSFQAYQNPRPPLVWSVLSVYSVSQLPRFSLAVAVAVTPPMPLLVQAPLVPLEVRRRLHSLAAPPDWAHRLPAPLLGLPLPLLRLLLAALPQSALPWVLVSASSAAARTVLHSALPKEQP